MILADTIVVLNRPRWLCFFRIAKRVFAGYGRVRTDLAPGCPEQFDWEFLVYVWQFKSKNQPLLEAAITRWGSDCRLLMSRSERDLDAFLAEARSLQDSEQ